MALCVLFITLGPRTCFSVFQSMVGISLSPHLVLAEPERLTATVQGDVSASHWETMAVLGECDCYLLESEAFALTYRGNH